MTQLNLRPNDQISKNEGKKSIGVLSAAVLAILAFLIIGGLVYGADKVFNLAQNLKAGDYQKSFQNIIFSGGGNANHPINQAPKIPSVNMSNDCLDSDAGLSPRDIYSSGSAALSKNGIIVSAEHDSCLDNFTVEEVKCWKETNGGNYYFLQGIPYPCSKGCINGACKE